MRTLSLLIPGLFDALATLTAPAPQPPALLMLLARARRKRAVAGDGDAMLLQLFGLVSPGDTDAPVAALSRLGEEDAAHPAGYWLRADPVHLRADQARLLLFGPHVLAVCMDEARALAAAFNAMYSGAGWQLETPHPLRWYLRLPDDPGMRTHALRVVIGRNIDAFLPWGANGKRWHGVLNEIQMLLHAHPVNTAREEQGKLPVNSVWFWGGGYLPAIQSPGWTQICSVEPCARGLAVASGTAVASPADITAAWQTKGGRIEQLVMLPEIEDAAAYGAAEEWCAELMNLDRDWFAPALAALKRGGLDALRVHPGNNCVYEVTRAGLRRFWRPRHTLAAYKNGM